MLGISNGWGLFYRNDHCVKPNKPTISTIWGWFTEPIYSDLADGLWHWVYHIRMLQAALKSNSENCVALDPPGKYCFSIGTASGTASSKAMSNRFWILKMASEWSPKHPWQTCEVPMWRALWDWRGWFFWSFGWNQVLDGFRIFKPLDSGELLVFDGHESSWTTIREGCFERIFSLGPSHQVHGPSASSGSSNQGGWDRLELNSSHWVWWPFFRKEVIETSNVCGSKKLFISILSLLRLLKWDDDSVDFYHQLSTCWCCHVFAISRFPIVSHSFFPPLKLWPVAAKVGGRRFILSVHDVCELDSTGTAPWRNMSSLDLRTTFSTDLYRCLPLPGLVSRGYWDPDFWRQTGHHMNPAWISHGKKRPVLLDSADLRARGAASSELCSGCPGPVGIPNITGGLGMEITGFSLNKRTLFGRCGVQKLGVSSFLVWFEAHLLYPLCGHGQRDVPFLLHPSEGKLSVPLWQC